MTEIKKCPHCGGEAVIKTAGWNRRASCKNIECTAWHCNEAEAITAWNTRKSLTLDEIREVLVNNSFKLNFLSCDGCELENEDCGNSEDCFKVESLMQEFEKKARG